MIIYIYLAATVIKSVKSKDDIAVTRDSHIPCVKLELGIELNTYPSRWGSMIKKKY